MMLLANHLWNWLPSYLYSFTPWCSSLNFQGTSKVAQSMSHPHKRTIWTTEKGCFSLFRLKAGMPSLFKIIVLIPARQNYHHLQRLPRTTSRHLTHTISSPEWSRKAGGQCVVTEAGSLSLRWRLSPEKAGPCAHCCLRGYVKRSFQSWVIHPNRTE